MWTCKSVLGVLILPLLLRFFDRVSNVSNSVVLVVFLFMTVYDYSLDMMDLTFSTKSNDPDTKSII